MLAPEILAGMGIGLVVGSGFSLWLLWLLSDRAQRAYPDLALPLPPTVLARAEPDLAAWGARHGYRLRPSLCDGAPCYRKGRGWLTSATELRLDADGRLHIHEVVNLLFGVRRFALNAPLAFGKPVRARKLKALNLLLAQWQLPPLRIDKDAVTVQIKS